MANKQPQHFKLILDVTGNKVSYEVEQDIEFLGFRTVAKSKSECEDIKKFVDEVANFVIDNVVQFHDAFGKSDDEKVIKLLAKMGIKKETFERLSKLEKDATGSATISEKVIKDAFVGTK